MRSEVLNWPDNAQGCTWVFRMSPALLRNKTNTPTVIGKIMNNAKLS